MATRSTRSSTRPKGGDSPRAPRRPGRAALRAGGRSKAARRAAPARRPRARRSLGWRLVRWTAAGFLWLIVGLIGAVAWFAWDLPDTREIAMPELRPAVTVVAADGGQVARYGDMTGEMLPVSALPPDLVNAVLAIEDRRFYDHLGVDPIGIARALWVNWQAGATVQGGSTITQQAAKNLFLTPERTLRRKIQEAMLAVWLELNYSKDQILTAYLNRVYFGSGTYGIDAAARAYFGVSASEVNLHQAAILAGILKAPSRYSPQADPDAAEARAEVVLDAMVDAGYLNADQRAAAEETPLIPQRRPSGTAGSRYFADWIAGQVPSFAGNGYPALTAETTLDPGLQRTAEDIVASIMASEGPKVGASQAALVAMRPDGAVVAMVGGVSYADSQFNRATSALRQPGSAFKTFVYLSAVEQGLIGPDSLVEDGPIDIAGWSPANFDERFRGMVTVREAFANSYNTAAVRVLETAGIARTVDLARRLGFTSTIRPEASLALGTSEVTLLDLTGAYAVLANRGQGVWPYGIERIAPRDGPAAYARTGGGPGETVLPWHVDTMNALLSAVMTEGTGRSAALADRPSVGKSGTSQNYRDAWFVGYTGDLVVGVWVGNDDGSPMKKVTGGSLPARIWHDFMTEAERGRPVVAIPGLQPATIAPTTAEPDAIADLLQSDGGAPAAVTPTTPAPTMPAPTAVVLRPFDPSSVPPPPEEEGTALDRLLTSLAGG